jgi:hypothetical protein
MTTVASHVIAGEEASVMEQIQAKNGGGRALAFVEAQLYKPGLVPLAP